MMLFNRIVSAFTFRREVYAEVEHDINFTSSAWLIVIIVTFINQFTERLGDNFGRSLIGSGVGTVFGVLGFAVAIYVVTWVGRSMFNAEVNFDEMLRTLGLAYVWRLVAGFGAIVKLFGILAVCFAPALIAGGVGALIASMVAAKEALDLDWTQTIVTVVLGAVAFVVVRWIATAILGVLGFTTVVITGGILGGL